MGHIAWLARTLGQETKKKLTLLQSCVLGFYESSLPISRWHIYTQTSKLPLPSVVPLTHSELPVSELFPEAGETWVEKGKRPPWRTQWRPPGRASEC